MSIDFEFLSEKIHHSSLDLECTYRAHNNIEVCKNIHKTWERVFGVNIENQECIFGAGAQFIVSKKKYYTFSHLKRPFYMRFYR